MRFRPILLSAFIATTSALWAQDGKEAVPAATTGATQPQGRPFLHKLPPDQLTELAELHRRYATPTLLNKHEAWHRVNGPGGTQGVGSGARFLEFHRDMLRDFDAFLGQYTRLIQRLPQWDPNKPIPPQLPDPNPDTNPRNTTIERFRRPSWTTAKGGNAPDPLFGYRKIGDFKSVDELGRALATTDPKTGISHHARGHVAVGGTMAGFGSPADPIFWPWHAHIDEIWRAWESTPNGKKGMIRATFQRALTRAAFAEAHGHGTDPRVAAWESRLRSLTPADRARLAAEPLFPENMPSTRGPGAHHLADPMQPRAIDWATSAGRHMLIGTAEYIPAYLLKEAIKAAEQSDANVLTNAIRDLGTIQFWKGMAVMTGAMYATEVGLMHLPWQGLSRGLGAAGLPMAVGMGAMHLLSGHSGALAVEDALLGTASYLASGAFVNFGANLLFSGVGPFSTPVTVALSIAKLTATLYLGEKLHHWLNGLHRQMHPAHFSEEKKNGVTTIIDSLHRDH